MWFHVDHASGVPIYVQIVEQVKKATASGLLSPGEQMPSVRELAVELTVNPNTVARAYQELEREGIIQTLRGRGTFVSQAGSRQGPEERQRALRQAVQKLLVEAHHLQAERHELEEIFQEEIVKWYKKK